MEISQKKDYIILMKKNYNGQLLVICEIKFLLTNYHYPFISSVVFEPVIVIFYLEEELYIFCNTGELRETDLKSLISNILKEVRKVYNSDVI